MCYSIYLKYSCSLVMVYILFNISLFVSCTIVAKVLFMWGLCNVVESCAVVCSACPVVLLFFFICITVRMV